MSWCDKLASTAAAGFRLPHHFLSSSTILDSLSPILDRQVVDKKQAFSVEQQDSYTIVINTNEGFKYGIDPERIHVTFNHRMKPKAVSGGAPIMEMISKPQPFTKLLPQVLAKLAEATLLIPSPKKRGITRVGIISATAVDEKDVPPGIAKLLAYIGKPWGGLSGAFNIQFTTAIAESKGFSDRCVHTLLRSDDPNELLTLQFDFQRTYEDQKAIAADSLKELSTAAEKSALRYFEELAEGNMLDEESFSNAAIA